MLETVKYLCEFFFGNGSGWHFLGLCVIFLIVTHREIKIYNTSVKKKEEGE